MIKEAINKINEKEILDCIVSIKEETDKEVIFEFNKSVDKEILLYLELLLCSFMGGDTFLIPVEEYKDSTNEARYKKTTYDNACNFLIKDILT